MGIAFIFGLFALYRILGFLTAFFIPNFIPYLGFFPYKAELDVYPEPDWVTGWANFDGIHYMGIAGGGYHQYEEAYFPLYSLVMHVVGPLFHKDYLITGLVVANVACFFGLWYFSKYAQTLFKDTKKVFLTLIFLLSFPTAFFFGAVYTEGLFLLVAAGYLYSIRAKKPSMAIFFGYLAGLTRLVGVFLIIPFFVEIYTRHVQLNARHKTRLKPAKLLWTSLMDSLGELAKKPISAVPFFTPILGLLTYMGFLELRTGDPLYFINTQPIFGAHRSTHLILLPQVLYRYIKIFITAQHNFQYWGALIEFTTFMFVLCLLLWEHWRLWKRRFDEDVPARLGLNLFSLANIMLPTLTGTLTSTPRYAVFSLSIYLILAEIKHTWLKVVLAVVFAALEILFLGLFIQGYFIG
jgi:hypothetical protein